MKIILLISSILMLCACSAEPGSEKWCETKKDQPKLEWSASDVKTYTMNCLIDGTTIGSEKWCEELASKPKGEWSADEVTSYAKHCLL